MNNKLVLVTGATSGIGKKLASHLLSKGYSVLGLGRDRSKISELLANTNFEFRKMDFTKVEMISDLFLSYPNKFDGFVHCAGIEETLPLSLYTPERVRHIFDVNVFSAIEFLRFLSKKKYSNDGASYLLLSSVMGELGQAGKVGYCASKAALLGIIRSAALELAKRNIRVNAISPGIVETPLTQKLFSTLDSGGVQKIKDMHPLGIGSVENIAPLAELLLSDGGAWITGQNIKVDGGYSVQ